MKNWINKYGGWLIVIIIVFGPLTWLVADASAAAKRVTKEMDINKLPNGTRVYEVRHNGSTYVVVENHKGVGICPKVNSSFDTNLISTPFNIKTK